MSVIAGIGGATRNAAAALCHDGRIVAVCEQERITRTRHVGLRPGRLPAEALDTVLRIGGRTRDEIRIYAAGELAIELPPGLPLERVDHHAAHAATAFNTSSFRNAVVLVCDRHGSPEVSVWLADDTGIRSADFRWAGPGFASVYSQAALAFGFAPGVEEHRLEALARVADSCPDATAALVGYRDGSLAIAPHFDACLEDLLLSHGSRGSVAHAARVASDIQRSIGACLLRLLADVKSRCGGTNLCLAGGLFYNSYLNSLLAESGIYERAFVPVNPGNAGIAIGAALSVAGRDRALCRGTALSPFLGPGHDAHEIKSVLENCKLSYDYVSERQAVERTVEALSQGKLVGWFQGRMEWGPRALGNRSILASPLSPFVLENLNAFLKHRAAHRSYSVSVCAEDLSRFFNGPPSSEFMEYDYDVVEREPLQTLLPLNGTRLRVQTVAESSGAFHALIKAFGALMGVPVLVNTSFNGFNEPIVCTPRDAIRVFYGTGLDMAVIGRFVLHK